MAFYLILVSIICLVLSLYVMYLKYQLRHRHSVIDRYEQICQSYAKTIDTYFKLKEEVKGKLQ